MRLHRFYIETEVADFSQGKEDGNTARQFVIKDSELIHQLLHVFRYEVGTELIVFNGNRIDYSAVIESIDKKSLVIKIISEKPSQYSGKSHVYLLQSITKPATFDTIVEKATELGVGKIIPIISERSERKEVNSERLNKIIKEAVEQSGRGDVPTLHEPVSFSKSKFLEHIPGDVFVFDMTGESIASIGRNMDAQAESVESKNKKSQAPISIVIGPEGGWSPAELLWFREKNFNIISFDTPVLRAETAAISALAILLCK